MKIKLPKQKAIRSSSGTIILKEAKKIALKNYSILNKQNKILIKETSKNLYKKISEIKKYYSSADKDENYDQSLSILAGAKKEVFEFFDNVQVNEENETLRKNRLELINMLCKTFQNFINFRLLKANNE